MRRRHTWYSKFSFCFVKDDLFLPAQECTDSLLDQLDQQLKITEDECKDYRDFLEKLSRGSEEAIDEDALNRELKQVRIFKLHTVFLSTQAFLSTPVLIHGGLICIALCLPSICPGPKCRRLGNKSYLKKYCSYWIKEYVFVLIRNQCLTVCAWKVFNTFCWFSYKEMREFWSSS